jgi:hypothetical protein
MGNHSAKRTLRRDRRPVLISQSEIAGLIVALVINQRQLAIRE